MKILVISDLFPLEGDRLKSLVISERPDLVAIAGDVFQFGREPQGLFQLLEESQIHTLTVRGDWDDKNSNYTSMFARGGFQFIHDISEKYFEFHGFTFLGIPFSFFSNLRKLRLITQSFPRPVDFVVTHPPTLRRIWVFELNPNIVLMGHYDLRVCKVSSTLLIATNNSPFNHAIIQMDSNRAEILYREEAHSTHSIYSALWLMDTRTLTWNSNEHAFNQNEGSSSLPRYQYPKLDREYGNMLSTLLHLKRTKSRSEILNDLPKLLALKIPKTMLHEFLGIS